MKNIKILLIGLFFTFFSFAANSQEECEFGVNKITTDIQLYVASGFVKPTSDDINTYITECIKRAQGFSAIKRRNATVVINEASEYLETHLEAVVASIDTETATATQIENLAAAMDNMNKLKSSLEEIELTFKYKLPKNLGWGDGYQFSIHVGYEATSASELEDKNTARGVISSYTQLRPVNNIIKERDYIKNACIEGNDKQCKSISEFSFKYMLYPHFYGQYIETTAGEQSNASQGEDITSSSEFDFGLILPFAIFDKSPLGHALIGVIYGTNFSKQNGIDEYTQKEFKGIRFAHSPNMYTDILQVKYRGSIEHKPRTELRFQTPIGHIGDGIVLFGLTFNHGRDTEFKDSQKLYFIWEYPFDD